VAKNAKTLGFSLEIVRSNA